MQFSKSVPALLGVAVLCVSGCSDSSADGSAKTSAAVRAVALTAEKTASVGSYTESLKVEGPTAIEAAGKTQLTPAYLSSLDITGSAAPQPGVGPLTGAKAVVTADAFYLRAAALKEVGGGKPWLRVTLGDTAFSAMLAQLKVLTPVELTRVLTASADAEEAGKEQIGDVPTVRYTVTVDAAKAAAALEPDAQAAMKTLLRQAGAATVAYDAWIGKADGLPHKIVMRANGTTATLLLSDYGKPVAIKVPALRETKDAGSGL